MIKRLDGSTIDFSWLLCCKFKNRSTDEDLSMAMRFAVRDDILKFRETAPIICNICKETSDEFSGNFHVDHYNPPFRELKQRFLESYEQIPKEFNSHPTKYVSIFKDKDREFETAWADYHTKHCNLQLLCAKCNLRKGWDVCRRTHVQMITASVLTN